MMNTPPTLSNRVTTFAAAGYLALIVSGCGDSGGTASSEMNRLRHWNEVAVDASGRDHTPVSPAANLAFFDDAAGARISGDHVFGEQLGPIKAARAMAIVHMAIFEAVNAVEGGYTSAIRLPAAPPRTSVEAAMAQAAHDTLAALYPSQTAIFDGNLADDLAALKSGPAVQRGLAVGGEAAATILAIRAEDGSDQSEPHIGVDYLPGDEPGAWRQDPISHHTLALGANWSDVRPFVIETSYQFRIPPPPALSSRAYAKAFEEVKRLGGDGVVTPTERTEEQTFIGTFWAYDGTPSLCAPPRLYNQIAMQIASDKGTDMVETARLLALVNVAMADAGIAAWESKYYYAFWRPVGGIREADEGTGPSGKGDGNVATEGDPEFTPLGAPASNLNGPNFTPPFPAYPSGHAVFGAALFEVLRRFYDTDDVAFTFVSDEFNGVTKDHDGNVRPLRPRTFASFSQAEQENGQSRIYLGIHWSFDRSEGIAQGRNVGRYVYDYLYRPRP